jgi:hypothetical protein
VEEGEFISFPIEVFDADNELPALQIIDGELPEGFSLNGYKIEGAAQIGTASDETYIVTMLLEDSTSLSSTAQFKLKVLPYNNPPQITFNGEVLDEDLFISLSEDFTLSDWRNHIESFTISDVENDTIFTEVISLAF